MTALIIPAHNESAVIARTLSALLGQVGEDDEIIVVCNGCTDDTVAIARRFEPRVTVIDSPVPSKTAALNAGDRQAESFPRVYLDADVTLAEGALQKVVNELCSGRWLAVSADPVMDLGGASWPVRAYYGIWLSLPYVRLGMIGAGMYALSEVGRRRFVDFPDVIADDGYVRAMFKEHERSRVAGAQVTVHAPRTLPWLIKIKTRSRLGGMELAAKFPELRANEVKDYSGALLKLLRNPLRWPNVLVYLYVNLISRMLAKRRFGQLSQYQWEKDLSSRGDAE